MERMKFSEYINNQGDEFMKAGDGYNSLGDLSKKCIDTAVARYVSEIISKWEHKCETRNTSRGFNELEFLNENAEAGWELISVVHIGTNHNNGDEYYKYYFKRPITN